METTLSSNYLTHSLPEFTDYQIEIVDRIFNLILERNFRELGILVNTIPTRRDYVYVHFAFYDKYEFGWLSTVEKMCCPTDCVKYGFYNYNFSSDNH